MTSPPISRYPVPELEDLPADVRERIEAVAERSGFIPNVFLVLARRPEEFRAFFAFHDALMDRDTGLTKGEKELIVVATSAANSCHYCVIAHGAIARIRLKNPLIADQVATNWRRADVTEKQRVMLRFAMKVATQSSEIDDSDHEEMRSAGWTDDDIWEVGAIAAFFAMSNRLANLGEIRPNDEFYALGR